MSDFYWLGNLTAANPALGSMTGVGTSWSSQIFSASGTGSPLLSKTIYGHVLVVFGQAVTLDSYSFTAQVQQTQDVAQAPGKSCTLITEATTDSTDGSDGTWTQIASHSFSGNLYPFGAGPQTFGASPAVTATMLRTRIQYTGSIPQTSINVSITVSAFSVGITIPSGPPSLSIPRARTRSHAPDGTHAPGAGRVWEVLKAGIVIASSAAPGGWSVGWNGTALSVRPPASATIGEDYEVRFTN